MMDMVPRILLLKLAIALAAIACAVAPKPAQPGETTRLCYTSIDGRTVHASLVRQQMTTSAAPAAAVPAAAVTSARPDGQLGGERLIGVTEVDGSATLRLVEDVTIDADGTLRRAEAVLSQAGVQTLRVVLDPRRGMVDFTTPGVGNPRHWRVPTDLPWVWAPLLRLPSSGSGVATAASARATWRAVAGAAGNRPVRLLDLTNMVSHTITADQLLVPDEAGDLGTRAAVDADKGVVVLGDDAIEVEGGMPIRLHLAALGVNVEPMDSKGLSGKLVASARCPSASGLSTP
jgi:hypothetical protein